MTREKYESLPLSTLKEVAKTRGLRGISTMKKADLIDLMLEEDDKVSIKEAKEEVKSEKAGTADIEQLDSGRTVNGILEVMDGYGFIRSQNYLPGEEDVYVSPSQIRRFSLKTGDILTGNTRVKTQSEKFSALLYLTKINGMSPAEAGRRMNFENMTPIFPNERLRLEAGKSSTAMRVMDLISPIGKGQRGMIVSPPKAGKTTLLKEIAKSVTASNPDMHLIILLIDERPEEVTDIKEEIKVVKERDPAIKSDIEVLLYPSFKVMLHYRIAHKLYLKKHYFLARWVSQRGVRKTGIEIHPGATIGKGLFIDHGSGVIIGETAILGDNITLYQGVTLGGTGKEQGKRHPTLEDNVMVSAGAKVIGSFTIGKNSKIGAGSVVIEEVPPNCTVVGVPGRIVRMGDQKVPSADLDQIHLPDPVLNDIRQLQTDNIRLKKELKALKEKLAKEKIIEEA